MPGSPAPLEPACLFRQLTVGQPNLAIGCAADPNRNPGNLHDSDRARFWILNVETDRFSHGGIDSSVSHAQSGLHYPRSTNKSVPPASQRFQVPPRALAEMATAESSIVQCTAANRLKLKAAPIKP